ncbi:hypothetical protein [Rhodococcus opacus]|uniref:Uncharacterized protein n=1 Tax=Rhodococcus opacus TaxID=37919 RepID=A0A076F0R8_RHOOP|nr:hypothetical protein [Rhodococcus opacus]AII11022.1 hypothetical protein EP51_43840 [Rhodococcus opacus]
MYGQNVVELLQFGADLSDVGDQQQSASESAAVAAAANRIRLGSPQGRGHSGRPGRTRCQLGSAMMNAPAYMIGGFCLSTETRTLEAVARYRSDDMHGALTAP